MTRLTVIDGSLAERKVTRLEVVDTDGVTVRLIQRAEVVDADGSTLREFFRYFSADFTLGGQTSVPLGTTGNYLNTRTLTSVITGGTGPFTYSWTEDDGTGTMTLTPPTSSSTFARTTTIDGEPGSGGITANVTLNVTDTATAQVATITKPVTITAAF